MFQISTHAASLVHTRSPRLVSAWLPVLSIPTLRSCAHWFGVVWVCANPVPADGKFVVTFPANFDVTGATVTAITGQTGAAGLGHMINCAGQVCMVTRGTWGSPGIFTAGVTTVVFGVVKNPAVSGATGTFAITTSTNNNATIDTLASATGVTIIPGVISVADVTPASLVAGASGAATATFTTAN